MKFINGLLTHCIQWFVLMRAASNKSKKCDPLFVWEPDKPERFDTEYERNGVSNLFMMFEPLTGWRHVEITDHRTAVDWAHQVKFLTDVRYKAAKKVILIGDNLNTHSTASLYGSSGITVGKNE